MHHCPSVSDAARKLPGAEIDWVVEAPFAGVAAMHRAVRRVIPVALRRWRRAPWSPAVWREMAEFRRALSQERYDAVVDTQGLLKSAIISSFASGPRHGLDRASAREALAAPFYRVTHSVPRALHAVERNRLLTASALGYALDGTVDYGLATKHPSLETAPAPYAVFLTMTSRDDKLWPDERWIELGRSLGTRIVLPWGSAAEKMRSERIGAEIGNATVPSRMSLGELSALFQKADLAVGLDTGLTHLAAALGVRTVGIFCGSDPALTGLYGAPNAVNVGAIGRPPAAADVLRALA